jgi:hypothetical protein
MSAKIYGDCLPNFFAPATSENNREPWLQSIKELIQINKSRQLCIILGAIFSYLKKLNSIQTKLSHRRPLLTFIFCFFALPGEHIYFALFVLFVSVPAVRSFLYNYSATK